jgi:hypothetical protein
MKNSDVEAIELSISEAQQYVDRMNSLLALSKNKDFINLIERGYFEREASRLVLLKADNNMQKEEDQAGILRAIDAIGHFRQYLSQTMSVGRMMEKSLIEDQQTRREMLSEGEE